MFAGELSTLGSVLEARPPSGQDGPSRSGECPRSVRVQPPSGQPNTPIWSGSSVYGAEFKPEIGLESESLESRILPLQAAAFL